MKASFLFIFICYANGFEESVRSYVFPTEDGIMVHHFPNNPRRSDGGAVAETMNTHADNIEINKSGKLIHQKILAWLVTNPTQPTINREYTVYPTVMMQHKVRPVSASPYFPDGYHLAAVRKRSGRKMLLDSLTHPKMHLRFRRASKSEQARNTKVSAKSSDEVEDSNELKKSFLRSRGGKSNEKNSPNKQGAFYHGSDLERFDDKEDDEPRKNDRDDRHSSEMYKKNERNDKKSSETYKKYDRDDKRSLEKNNYRDDTYDKKSKTSNQRSRESGESGKREREPEKDDRKSRKGSFKPGGSIEYEKEEKQEKRHKRDSGENNKKYSKDKKGYQSDRMVSDETPREKSEKARDLGPKSEKSRDRDEAGPGRSRDRDADAGRDRDEDAHSPTRSRDEKDSGEEKRPKKHKRSHKRHHKKSRATRKSKGKVSKQNKTGRKSNRIKTSLHNPDSNGMGWPKLGNDASYENFRRHYYSNPRRQKREIFGFESGKPYKIGDTRRLIAATTARIEDFPYMASIQKYGEHWCSGAILNQRVVITTANCVWRSVDLSRMKVRVGSRHAMDGGQITDIQEVAKHPGWSLRQRSPNFDLALLLTTRPFKFCDTVHSVDLPNKNMYPAFDDAFIASFGSERRDGVMDDNNPTLQSYRADMIPREDCNKMTKRFNVNVTENFICFAQRGRRAPCTRDTGAPAVSDGVVWGVASWSIRKKCGTERYPAVFSYTASIDNIHFLINATLNLMSEKRLPTYYDKLGTLDPQGNRHPIG